MVSFFLKVLFSLMVCLVLQGCSRPPDLIGVEHPEVSSTDVPGIKSHKVFIMTSRARSSVEAEFYSRKRSEQLGLSSVIVTVPPRHATSKIERSKSNPPDPRRSFTVVEPVVYETDDGFLSSINRELAKRPPEDRTILGFIHGYNMTLSDATLRLTQFVEDSGFEGVPVLFSWASYASVTRYVYDLNSALQSRVQMVSVANLLTRSDAKRVDVLAWSMGSFAIMEGIVYAATTGQFDRKNRLKNVILASPDIDLDLFRAQLTLIPEVVDDIYILTSKADFALKFSSLIAGRQTRLGHANLEQLEGLGVSVIDLSEVDDVGTKSHGKFAESPQIVQLIGRGLQDTNSLGEVAGGETVSLPSLLIQDPRR